MSDLSWPSDSDSEGKSPGWRHWWEREKTPSSSSSPSNDGIEEDAIADDSEGEEQPHEIEEHSIADDSEIGRAHV